MKSSQIRTGSDGYFYFEGKRVIREKKVPITPLQSPTLSKKLGVKAIQYFNLLLIVLFFPVKILGNILSFIWNMLFQPPSWETQKFIGFLRTSFFLVVITYTAHSPGLIFNHTNPLLVSNFWSTILTGWLHFPVEVSEFFTWVTQGFVFLGLILGIMVMFGFYNNVQADSETSASIQRYSGMLYKNIGNFLMNRDEVMNQSSNKERVEILRNTGLMTKNTFERDNLSKVEQEAFSNLDATLGQMTNSEQIKFMTRR